MIREVIHYDRFYTFTCPQNKTREAGLGSKLAELKERFPDHVFEQQLISSHADWNVNNDFFSFEGPFCSC